MLTLLEFEKTKKLMIAAHRGSSESSTENTLAAFSEAIEAGIHIIELDIHFTLDNQIIVFHDNFAPNTDTLISELNYDEIKKIELKSNQNFDKNSRYIPLLEDVLKLVKNKCYLMIEIKVSNDLKFYENINNLINLIIENNYEQNTILGSFNFSFLKKIKELNPKIYTAAIKNPQDSRLPSQLCKEYFTDAFICSIDEINKDLEFDTLQNKIFFGVYGIDDAQSLDKIMKFDVRAIATDYPERIISLLKKYY